MQRLRAGVHCKASRLAQPPLHALFALCRRLSTPPVHAELACRLLDLGLFYLRLDPLRTLNELTDLDVMGVHERSRL
eukprot:4875023-Alexandrium_andersonii.AAC.1